MEKPKRRQRRLLRGQIILLSLMIFGTALVMAGAIFISTLALVDNRRMDSELSAYRATVDAMAEREVATSTPVPTVAPAHTYGCVIAGVNVTPVYCASGVYHMQTMSIEQDTVYKGESTQQTLLTGDNTQQTIFIVNAGATLLLENISIVNSTYRGIIVEEGGTLELRNCALYGHGRLSTGQFGKYGGAIWNAGTVTIDNCVLDHNMTSGGGAALFNTATGKATIRNSWIQNSTSRNDVYTTGTAILNNGILTIENSNITGNTSARGSGAALANFDGNVTLTNVLFENNKTDDRGGAIYNAASMTASGLTVRFNTAGSGGGIFNMGLLTISGSYIDLNTGNCVNQGRVDDRDRVCSAAR